MVDIGGSAGLALAATLIPYRISKLNPMEPYNVRNDPCPRAVRLVSLYRLSISLMLWPHFSSTRLFVGNRAHMSRRFMVHPGELLLPRVDVVVVTTTSCRHRWPRVAITRSNAQISYTQWPPQLTMGPRGVGDMRAVRLFVRTYFV